ncbi:MAG: DUF6048 family protein [Candidatus Azobacteroides sp.]|nr:DUF6048 family protein [Candidatus Azobacteroides sp.]
MKNSKTYKYSFNFFLFLFVFQTLSSQGVLNNIMENNTKPFFQGIYVGTDLFSPVASFVGEDWVSLQLSLHANLDNKFFPVWEIGMGKGDTVTEEELKLHTDNALFNRIGINFNVLKRKEEDFVFAGLRYGFSSFNYHINNIVINGGYWDDTIIENPGKQSATVTWGELLAGINVHMFSGLYMGWSVGYKIKFTEKADNEHLKAWYIPGYGTSKWGMTYNIYYKLPFFSK